VSWTHTRSKIAHTKRRDPSADVTELVRQMRAEKLEDYIKRTVDQAPPLTAEQRARLAGILAGGQHAS
jgi:acyl-CoA reductase-like NAD-dependent aldehyde dehydrogenase